MAPAEPPADLPSEGPSHPVPGPGACRGLLQATPSAPPGVALAWFTLAWIILQGIFGAWTVTLKLKPLVVTGHLLGGMVLFGLLLAQAVRVAGHPPVVREAARYGRWAARAGQLCKWYMTILLAALTHSLTACAVALSSPSAPRALPKRADFT
jgi:heme A synthase